MYPKTLKKSRFLIVLVLLVGLSIHVRATESTISSSKDKKIATGPKNTLSSSVSRPGELLIPANGHCLYTSLVLGYLLPVVDDPRGFEQRLRMMVDTKCLPITHNELARQHQEVDYLDGNSGFQQVIQQLLKETGIKSGTWGGLREIQLVAEKLNVNIQEYTPNPDDPMRLVEGDFTQPKTWLTPSETTIHIVQDVPVKEELVHGHDDPELKEGKISSLNTPQNRQHYRLYYRGGPAFSSKKGAKNQAPPSRKKKTSTQTTQSPPHQAPAVARTEK